MHARLQTLLTFPVMMLLLLLGTIAAPLAHAGETVTMEQLRQQLDALSTEVHTLRAAQNQTWLNEQRTAEVKALVKEVLADADTRASLLENSMTAGYNNGFFLASEDGNFKVRVMGMLEFRYALELRNNSGADDGEHGFEIPATRFGFKGHIIDPSWQFFIWTGQNVSGGYAALDATITKVLNSNWSIKVGTTKVPFLREYLVSETAITFPDRTPLASVFSGGYTEGIWINYQKDNFRGVLSLNDGMGNLYTPYTSSSDAEGLAISGRGELLLAGNWKQAGDIEAWVSEDPFLMVGGAVHYQKGENSLDASIDEARQLSWTIDANLKYKGFSLATAFMAKHISDTAVEKDQLGLLIQGGLFLTPDLELIARYAWGDSDTANEEDLQIVSVGLSKFFKGHALKLTGELGYALNAVEATWANSGWRKDATGEDGQIMARAELHLLF
jgi:hypothetical protein